VAATAFFVRLTVCVSVLQDVVVFIIIIIIIILFAHNEEKRLR